VEAYSSGLFALNSATPLSWASWRLCAIAALRAALLASFCSSSILGEVDDEVSATT
jgi:hypothetical protein